MKMKYGFYISGNAGRFTLALQENILHGGNTAFALTDNLRRSELYKVTGNSKLKEACEKQGIPLFEYSYEKNGLTGKERNKFISDKFLDLLNKYKCNYGFLWGGGLLLTGDILSKYEWKLINFHPSILPAYKGMFKAIDLALKDKTLLLGNTAHFVNEFADDGTTIMQSIISANNFIDYDSVLNLQIPMFRQIISWIEQKRFCFENGKFYIKDAKYQIGTFIPNLEEDTFCN